MKLCSNPGKGLFKEFLYSKGIWANYGSFRILYIFRRVPSVSLSGFVRPTVADIVRVFTLGLDLD